jgi:cell division protein FtsB
LTLENISNTVRNLNQSQQSSDDYLENWQPLTANIDAFIAKKKQLQVMEKQMNQTISEMHELHQKMIDSIGVVRDYNAERAQMYLERKKIADELGRQLL